MAMKVQSFERSVAGGPDANLGCFQGGSSRRAKMKASIALSKDFVIIPQSANSAEIASVAKRFRLCFFRLFQLVKGQAKNGQSWIRTSEGECQRIYSPPRLATSVSALSGRKEASYTCALEPSQVV
jgi:hypothetical protein